MSLMPIFRTHKPRRHHVYDHHPFTRDIWSPFDDFHHMDHGHVTSFHMNITKFEWKETPEAHVLRAELPGFKKEEVKVEVEGEVLKISGKKQVEREENRENWQYFEHSQGQFLRAFTLAGNVKHDEVRCSWENGVLTVTVPKRGC